MMDKQTRYRQYLNYEWLRPESALLNFYMSQSFADVAFPEPSVDIGCGDGLFLFTHFGGVLGMGTDRFSDTGAKTYSHGQFQDIYDSHVRFDPDLVKPSPVQLTCATDWKQALLDKARPLNLYRQMLLHDSNTLPLPFASERFRTIYSNSVYWITHPQALLADIRRILAPGGTAILEMMSPTWLSTLDELGSLMGPRAIDLLDRQRRITMGGARPYADWARMLEGAGFEIMEARNVFPHKLLVDIWNVGLRPVGHLLIRMAEALSPLERASIKKEWIDIMMVLGEPLLDLPQTYAMEDSPYICFIVRRSE